MTKPSLRHIAGELGILSAYLSYMFNSKRPWRKDLYQRYMGVVNTFVNTGSPGVNNPEIFNSLSVGQLGTAQTGGGEGNRTLGPLHAKQVLSR